MVAVNNLMRHSHTRGTATVLPGTFDVRISGTEVLTMTNPVLIAGGGIDDPDFPGEADHTVAEIYDWGTNRFYVIAPMTEPRTSHIAEALVAPDGTPIGVLVAGSGPPELCTQSAEVWEIATQTWRPVAAMIHCRRDARANRFFTGEILVVGGAGDTMAGRTAEIFQYDPVAPGRWRATAAMNCSHEGRHSSTLVVAARPRTPDHPAVPERSRVVVAGGYDGVIQNVSDCAEIYSLVEDRWVANRMAAPQFDHVGFLLWDRRGAAGQEGIVVIAGGADTAHLDPTRRTQVLDVARFSAGWLSDPGMDMLFARYEHAATTIPGDLAYGPAGTVHGGRTLGPSILVYNRDEEFRYDPVARRGHWRPGPNHDTPRFQCLAAASEPYEGRLLIGGLGYDPAGDFVYPMRDGELFG